MKLIYTIVALSGFILSCSNSVGCNQIKINKEIKSWGDSLNEGDRYIMRSNFGNFDELSVIEKSLKMSTCNKFELGVNQYESYIILIESSNSSLTKNIIASLSFTTKSYLKENNKIKFTAFGMNWLTDSLEVDPKVVKEWIQIPEHNDSIESYKFMSTNFISTEPCLVKSFNWSKEYGLVRYELRENDEVYSYHEKLAK